MTDLGKIIFFGRTLNLNSHYTKAQERQTGAVHCVPEA